VQQGDVVAVQRHDGSVQQVAAQAHIPFGHKIALEDVRSGAAILKYGVPIGCATQTITTGQHVHVHNVRGIMGGCSANESAAQEVAAPPAPRYDVVALQAWVERVSLASGFSQSAAHDMAEALMDAESSGVATHGLRRLAPYLQRVASGAVNAGATPHVSGAAALLSIDGHNAPGVHVIRVAADAVAQRAQHLGASVGLVRHSNHAGALGWAANRIARQGMVALVLSNGPALIAPPGSTVPFLSNSPIAIAAPLGADATFLLDMATSTVSRDRVRQAAEKNAQIPLGWALDASGTPTSDAVAAMAGSMLPIGGPARGFALILGLELLSGVLPGALTDILVPSKDKGSIQPEGIGHFILAVDPAHLNDREAFIQRLQQLEQRLVGQSGSGGGPTPRLPGRRRQQLREQAQQQGLVIASATLQTLTQIARDTGCPLPAAREVSS